MTFLFDEQMSPKLHKAMRALGQPVLHVNDMEDEGLGRGSSDERIIRHASKRGYCIITLDRRIASDPHLKAIYMANPVGVYFLRCDAKKWEGWEVFELLVNHWQRIVAHAIQAQPPFMMLVQRRGLQTYR